MKPEWCPQWAWDAARNAISIQDTHESLSECVARALLDAHQRGKREGLEEAAEISQSWENTGRSLAKKTLGEEALHHDIAADMASDIKRAIRAKMEEA